MLYHCMCAACFSTLNFAYYISIFYSSHTHHTDRGTDIDKGTGTSTRAHTHTHTEEKKHVHAQTLTHIHIHA